MTSASNYIYVPATAAQTRGLAPVHMSQLQNASLQNGTQMPPAWQMRNAPFADGQRQDAPVRNFVDIALDPWRFLTATTLRKVGSAVIAVGLLLSVLF